MIASWYDTGSLGDAACTNAHSPPNLLSGPGVAGVAGVAAVAGSSGAAGVGDR